MTVEPAQPSLLESLRGEEQVDVQASTEPADREEQLGELGLGGEQLGELVDHDHQCGKRVERRTPGAGRFVLSDVRVVTGGPQDLLPPGKLTLERVAHPVDHRDLGLQVGDHRGHVRQRLQPEERRAAFEVHQDEVERVRVVGGDEPQDERAEELGFARARRADAQPVRSHAAMRRLLEVEFHGCAVGAHPHRDAKSVPLAATSPRHGRVDLGGHADAQQVGKSGGAPGAGGTVGMGHRVRGSESRQGHGEPLGFRQAHRIDPGDLLVTVLGADTGDAVVVDPHTQAAAQREIAQLPRAAPRDLDDGDAVQPVLGKEPLGAGHPDPVDDDDEVRPSRNPGSTR